MRARSRDLLPLVLVLAVAGCIKIDEWSKYNKDPGQPCESADECTSCPEGYDWACAGPPGDTGICPTRDGSENGQPVTRGVCRRSLGETGMNCTAETVSGCDDDYCIYASSQEAGVCSKHCDDGVCPARSVCIQTNKTGGGTMLWCAQKCTNTLDCATNATCQDTGTYGMVCFPN